MTFFPNADYKGFSSVNEMFIALQKGKIDAVVTDYTITQDSINKGGFSDLIIVEKIKLLEDQYAIGFRYGSDMTKKINEIINNMMSAEKYDLSNLYINNKNTEKFTIIAFLMILYAVLIIVL